MNKDLLAPRYEVIADYPDSNLEVGRIIGGDEDWLRWNERIVSKYPHLFRKLQWWEKRTKVNEMPEYIKCGYECRIAKGAILKAEWEFRNGEMTYHGHDKWGEHWIDASYFLPAAEQEYLNYLNQTSKNE